MNMKTIILIFMKLYCEKLGNDVIPDYRNYLHGFLGSIIFAVGLLATAEYLSYQNWFFIGALVGLMLAFTSGLIWEFIQGLDKDKKFTWRDVWASNIWFIPLWFITNILRKVASKVYRKAEKEFLK